MIRHVLWAIALVMAGSACVPIALPPVQGRFSAGIDTDSRVASEWRVAVHPAQLMSSQLKRPLMLGMGYVGRSLAPIGIGHGAYAEVGWIHPHRIGKSAVRRLSVSVAPELMHRDGLWGYGGALSLGMGWTHFGKGAGAGGRIAVASYGEAEIGLHLTGGVERFDGRTFPFILAGVRGSIPAIAGVIWAPELLRALLR